MKKDEAIDRLLERTAPARGAQPPGVCLDAETVAAWTEGSLTTAERSAAETHTADCDRCLALLAAMARTAPPPSAAHRPSWLSVRWLVPLTTAAVAITAWVVIQEPPAPRPQAPAPPAVDAIKPSEPSPSAEQQASNPRDAREADRSPARTAPPAEKPAAPPAAAAPMTKAAPELKDERRESFARMAQELPRVISSPDPDVRWRLAGAAVERSTDGGRTWLPQATGTTAELLAGSAPAPAVCWIVGRNGTVLLTTDGVAWRRLAFPAATADLVGVTATDATSATVTTADGRTYRTSDGGLTWTLQENPAAPF